MKRVKAVFEKVITDNINGTPKEVQNEDYRKTHYFMGIPFYERHYKLDYKKEDKPMGFGNNET